MVGTRLLLLLLHRRCFTVAAAGPVELGHRTHPATTVVVSVFSRARFRAGASEGFGLDSTATVAMSLPPLPSLDTPLTRARTAGMGFEIQGFRVFDGGGRRSRAAKGGSSREVGKLGKPSESPPLSS